MKNKNHNVVLFCVILCLINQALGQTTKCDYYYNHYTTNAEVLMDNMKLDTLMLM